MLDGHSLVKECLAMAWLGDKVCIYWHGFTTSVGKSWFLKNQSTMNHSENSGADVSHAATIHCDNGVTFSLSGTCLLPGNEHGDPPVGKEVQIQIYGSDGAIFFKGNDHDPKSGRLEMRSGKTGSDVDNEGALVVLCEDLGFQFENTDKDGKGPESLQSFISACLGKQDYYVGADSLVGFRAVQTLDAMYRSHQSGSPEDVSFRTGRRAAVRSTNRKK